MTALKYAKKRAKMKQKNTCWLWITCSERVANQSRITSALRPMILHAASGPRAANAWTRIATLVVHTGQLLWTVRVDGTLWFAFNVRVALKAGQTGTAGRATDTAAAFSVDTAGCWIARVSWRQRCSWKKMLS